MKKNIQKKKFVFLSVLLLFSVFTLAIGLYIKKVWSDEIVLTTYYPAPYGNYNALKSNSFLFKSDTQIDEATKKSDTGKALIYYNNTLKKMRISVDGSDWTDFGGGPWTKTNDNIYPTTLTDKVGIGTTGPQGLLNIVGDSNLTPHLVLQRSVTGTGVDIMWARPNGSLYAWDLTYRSGNLSNPPDSLQLYNGTVGSMMTWTQAGNVGIGTTGPQGLLNIVGDSNLTPHLVLQRSVTGTGVDIMWARPNGSLYAWDLTYRSGNLSNPPDSLQLYNGTVGPMMTWTQAGNVGIGTVSPAYKLDVIDSTGGVTARIGNTAPGPYVQGAMLLGVAPNNDPSSSILDLYGGNWTDRKFFFNANGSGQADGSFGGGGADYAEYFKNLKEDVIEKGTIVALEDGKVRIAKKDDNFIVGPVSTKPGFIGNNGETEEKREMHPKKWTAVALLGQTSVKVSLENGHISPGDYLTLSSIPGAAMKATSPGRVIGQALEAYDGKSKLNKILCFVNQHFWDGNVTVKVQDELSALKQENIALQKELASLKKELSTLQQAFAEFKSTANNMKH